MSVSEEENKEETKEDIDLNPLNHFRITNIYEINGNVNYLKCAEPMGKCKKIYKKEFMFSHDKYKPHCPMCKGKC